MGKLKDIWEEELKKAGDESIQAIVYIPRKTLPDIVASCDTDEDVLYLLSMCLVVGCNELVINKRKAEIEKGGEINGKEETDESSGEELGEDETERDEVPAKWHVKTKH